MSLNTTRWLRERLYKSGMEGKHLRTLASEIFKTINNINPKFMKNIFKSKNNAKLRPFDMIARLKNTESITHRNKKRNPFLKF